MDSPRCSFSPMPSHTQANPNQLEIKVRMQESVIELHNLVEEWNLLHNAGATVLSKIDSLKTGEVRTRKAINYSQAYTKSMQNECNSLENICKNLENVFNKLSLLTEQVGALNKLYTLQCNSKVPPLFITIKSQEFYKSFEKIREAYSKELAVKNTLKEQVAHSQDHNQYLVCSAMWQFQGNLNNSIVMLLESIVTEVSTK